jgi:quercetin dioxygenase-like cupin family protein
MKKMLFYIMPCMMITMACNNKAEVKGTAEESAPAMTKEQEEKAWMEYATPGAEHARMQQDSGTWNAEMTTWYHPDSAAIQWTAKGEVKMILNGHYQEGSYTGDFMGMPFEGRSVTAFDNAKKEYVSTWIDNMGTGVMIMQGKASADGKTLELKGKMYDPAQGKEVDARETMKIIDEKTQLMEMFYVRNGKEMKSMEMKMVKQ